MRPLTPQEQKTIRVAGIGLAIYLILYFGLEVWGFLESRRTRYEKLVKEAQKLRQDLRPYERKAIALQDLKEKFQLDPARVTRTTLVAETSAAIQKAAQGGGIQLGPLRETQARASAKELVSMQLEGMGPAPAITGFLDRLKTLGFPIVLDSFQLATEPAKPGLVKINLTIVILDFDQWKTEGNPRA